MRLIKIAAALLAVLILAAGCGDSEKKTAAGQAGTPNPCSLVTQEEATQALGKPVKAGAFKQSGNPLGQNLCYFEVATAESPAFVQVSLVTDGGMSPKMREGGYSALRLFRDSRQLLGEPPTVDGLGKEAFWGGVGLKAGSGLHVYSDGAYLTIIVSAGDKKKSLAASKELAASALQRLTQMAGN